MLRMGRNPKDDKSDTTADHTPQQQQAAPASNYSSSGYGSTGSSAASTNSSGGGSASATDSLYQNATHTPNTSRAVTESESLARDIKEGTLSGFVGNGTVLTGEATFKGMLRVDGHLSGRVSSQDGTLIISTNGQVDANIEVSVAQIYGTVNGDITATKRIEMGRVARVTGNIQTPALVIENGAMFEGSCRMVHLKDVPEKPQGRDDANATAPSTPSIRESSSSSSDTSSDISGLSDLSADAAAS